MGNKNQFSEDFRNAKSNKSIPKDKKKVIGHSSTEDWLNAFDDELSMMGYRDDSPYRDRSSIDIHTPTGMIDMSQTGIPLMANGQYLPPYSGMHNMGTPYVKETPIAKYGGWLDNLPQAQPGYIIKKDKTNTNIENKVRQIEQRDKDIRLHNNQTFVGPYNRTKELQDLINQDAKSEIYTKNIQKNILYPLDIATDIMQLGQFIPHPIAQGIGWLGNTLGAAVDADQAYYNYKDKDYNSMVGNLTGVGLGSALASQGYKRAIANVTPNTFAETLANIGSPAVSKSGFYFPLTAQRFGLSKFITNPVVKKALNANRGVLGAEIGELIYDTSNKAYGGDISLPNIEGHYKDGGSYADSLALYNLSQAQLKAIKKDPRLVRSSQSNTFDKANAPGRGLIGDPNYINISGNKSIYTFAPGISNNMYKSYFHPSIMPVGGFEYDLRTVPVGDLYMPLYKKPVGSRTKPTSTVGATTTTKLVQPVKSTTPVTNNKSKLETISQVEKQNRINQLRKAQNINPIQHAYGGPIYQGGGPFIIRDQEGNASYEPQSDTIYLSKDRGDKDMIHELYHRQQALAGRLRIPEYDPYGLARKAPAITEVDADYPYYNRRMVDQDEFTNEFLMHNPSFQFADPEAVYNYGVNPNMYDTPWTAEGEARAAESPEGREYLRSEEIGPDYLVPDKKLGGWLDKYQSGGSYMGQDGQVYLDPNVYGSSKNPIAAGRPSDQRTPDLDTSWAYKNSAKVPEPVVVRDPNLTSIPRIEARPLHEDEMPFTPSVRNPIPVLRKKTVVVEQPAEKPVVKVTTPTQPVVKPTVKPVVKPTTPPVSTKPVVKPVVKQLGPVAPVAPKPNVPVYAPPIIKSQPVVKKPVVQPVPKKAIPVTPVKPITPAQPVKKTLPVQKPITPVVPTKDKRQIPKTGVVVDKRTNQAYYFGDKDKGSFPVLTGKNPDLNYNPYDLDLLKSRKDLRNTPVGYYLLETLANNKNFPKGTPQKVIDDYMLYLSEAYDKKYRDLTPLYAFGIKAPTASNLGLHQTYANIENPKEFKRREKLYECGPNQRWTSYGCVNIQPKNFDNLNKAIPGRDTVLVLDSKRPDDLRLLNQAKARLNQKKKGGTTGGLSKYE